ncbi:MAG: transcriptional regulator [Provencibacterium sp.]|nr:transcriptional regulator [Provencibacterium sp.]
MNEIYCQSCGMPMREEKDFGKNADGSRNEDYCSYCFQSGAFTWDTTMEGMIDFCLQHGGEEGFFADREKARRDMLAWFPTLKRWKKG